MMRRFTLALLLAVMTALSAKAMSYEEARRQAWFLTDKMAYELNLTPEQYDRAYEINLDYLMSIRTAADCYGPYWSYRNSDFRCVLFDWQYSLFTAAEYFYRPVRWLRRAWYYPIVEHYRWGSYYYDRPAVYVSYCGRSWRRRSHNDPSPYIAMRPAPGYGMRDHYNGRPVPPAPRPDGRPGTRPSRPNNGFRPDVPGTRPARPGGDRFTPRPGSGTRPGTGGGSNGGATRPGGFPNTSRPGRNGSNLPGNSGNSGRGNTATPFRPAVQRVENNRSIRRNTGGTPSLSVPSRNVSAPARPTPSVGQPARSFTPSPAGQGGLNRASRATQQRSGGASSPASGGRGTRSLGR